MTSGTLFTLEVNPKLPPRLARLEELANNLHYSWDRQTRVLFSRLDPPLWGRAGTQPESFPQAHRRAETGRCRRRSGIHGKPEPGPFRVRYLPAGTPAPQRSEWLRKNDVIAYFCAEFGFHESLPIYSGGLGILAGDHCKSASDMRLPFVGMGLLYRQG